MGPRDNSGTLAQDDSEAMFGAAELPEDDDETEDEEEETEEQQGQ